MPAKTRRTPAAPATKADTPAPPFIDFQLRDGYPVRRMNTRIPTHEQLAVWQSIGETFTRLGGQWEQQNAAMADMPHDHPDAVAVRVQQNRQATRGLGRSLKLIKSVLADEADHEWVDDVILEGATLEELLRIVSQTVDELRKLAASKPGVNADAIGAKLAKAVLSE